MENASRAPMPNPKLALLAILLSSLTVSLFCQSGVTDPGAKRMCAAVNDIQVPPQDQPTSDEKQALANCVSQDLYFGFGGPADPVKARKCAYVEIEQGKDDLDIAGRAILTMVYANGRGADRNLDLALKFACEMKGAPGDLAGNIYELDRLKKFPPTVRFHVCDHSAAPHLYKSCAILQDRFDSAERARKIAAITSHWNEREKKSFAALQQAAQAFFHSRVAGEINLQPTFEVQEIAFLERGFLSKLQKLQQGELPQFSRADFRKAEADLKETYAATQTDPNRHWGTATAEGVRNTQKLWLNYRDAWVRFGKTKYPHVKADSWRTWITQERIAMLNVLLH
jgi:lysozyme inhibitor LprI